MLWRDSDTVVFALLIGAATAGGSANAQSTLPSADSLPRVMGFMRASSGIAAYPAGGFAIGIGGGLRVELGRYAQFRSGGSVQFVPNLISLAVSEHNPTVYAFDMLAFRTDHMIRLRTGPGASAFFGIGATIGLSIVYTDSSPGYPYILPRTREQRWSLLALLLPMVEIGAAFGPGGAFELSLEGGIEPMSAPPFPGGLDLEIAFAFTPARAAARLR